MKDKERLIIESAMKLFARKGYSSTSIQEIANECGIPKGSFYFYFKSKEDLLIKILEQFFSKLKTNTNLIGSKYDDPRERFLQQLSSLLEVILDHKEMFIMQNQENLTKHNEKIDTLLTAMKNYMFGFFSANLKNIYGSRIEKYIADLNIIIQGIYFCFIQFFIFEKKAAAEKEELAGYILHILDDIVEGLLSRQSPPLICAEMLQNLLFQTDVDPKDADCPKGILEQLKEASQQINDNGHLQVTIDVLEKEMMSDEPRLPVIKGMLSNLSEYPELSSFQKQLFNYYQIK